jgi:hypothetical protein
LTIQLLVGVQLASEGQWERPALFECQSNLVIPIQRTKQSSILGAGEVLKQAGIQFAGWGLDVKLAEWASLYLIHQAKRRFGGVGGKTHLFTMKTDGTFFYDRGFNSKEKEALLENFDRTCQLFMLSLSPSLTDSQSKDLIDSAKQWLSDARKHIKKVERERGQAKHESIEIRNREMEKLMRRLRSTTRSASQDSETN